MKLNKKASSIMFLLLLIGLVMGLVFITIALPLFDKITESAKDTVTKGICGGMMAIRSKMTRIIVSHTIKEAELFSLSPACGNAYVDPCSGEEDCKKKIGREINYCWEITRNDPSSKMACLYHLGINLTDTPDVTLCKSAVVPSKTSVDPNNIEFKDDFCANDKDSISIEYDGKKVIVKCL